jgi:hypothetical protein
MADRRKMLDLGAGSLDTVRHLLKRTLYATREAMSLKQLFSASPWCAWTARMAAVRRRLHTCTLEHPAALDKCW